MPRVKRPIGCYTEEETIRRDYKSWCRGLPNNFWKMNMWARVRNFEQYLRLPLENQWGEMEVFVKASGKVGHKWTKREYLKFDRDGKMERWENGKKICRM